MVSLSVCLEAARQKVGQCIINCTIQLTKALSRRMGKSVQFDSLRWQVAPPALTDYWAPMFGLVGQLFSCRPQVTLLRRLPMDWAFSMIGLAVHLAARLLQVALARLSPMDFACHEGELS